MICRFNERFLLSLGSCKRCLVVDDQLNVLPISSQNLKIESVHKYATLDEQSSLDALKESLQGTQPISTLINCCKTIDQVNYKDKLMRESFNTAELMNIYSDKKLRINLF